MQTAVAKWMRRWWRGARVRAALALLCGCLVMLPGAGAFAAIKPVVESQQRTVTVGVPAHWPPHYSLDEAGQPQGFAIDAIREIVTGKGLTLRYRIYADLPELDRAWRRGDIDIIPNAGITAAARINAAFSTPIETFAISIFVRKGQSVPYGSDALAGRKVSVVAGDMGYELLKYRSNLALVIHPDLQKALFALLSGKTDALVFPKNVLWHAAQSIGVEGNIEALEPPLGHLQRGIRVQRSEVALTALLNRGVARFKNTPKYWAIHDKWFGSPKKFWSNQRIIAFGIALLLVVTIIMAWWRYRTAMRLNLRLRDSLTERRLVEAELFRAKAQLEDAIESISEGFVLYDADERLVICNDIYKGLHPIAADLMVPGVKFEDIIRRAAQDGQHPASIGRFEEWITERLARFRNPGASGEQQFADGRWLQFSERRTRDGGTVGVRANITRLKKTEAALERSQARFKDFATSASDWFWEMDADLRFSYFSDRFGEVTGVEESNLLGKTRQETGIPDVDEAAWAQHLSDIAAHRAFRNFVHPRTSATGEVLWFSISGMPDFDENGTFNGFRGTGTDITRQKRTEYLLRESEQRLKAIMDHVPAALFLKDMDARYLLINKQFEEWFGVDPQNVIGKNAHDLYPAERAERYAQGDRKILETMEVTTDNVVIPGPDVDGKNFTLTKFPIFDAGEMVGFGGVMNDVTEQTRAEDILRQSENRAEMANRAKSEFLANMSHELRTPLNAIIGFAEIIKSGVLGPDSVERNQEYAGDIYESGQHLLDLINDILDISKIELGSEQPKDVDIDVPVLIASILVLMKERGRKANVEIATDFQDQLPFLSADERKLKQILINLVTNSLKFTEAGGTVELKVRCHPDQGYLFEVIDSGIGIAAVNITKAMQPFGQIDSALNRQHTGTGLGLPLAKELIEMHGGTLEQS